jgi:hypothetical protein
LLITSRHPHNLLPRRTIRRHLCPVVTEPLIRLLRNILVQDFALKLGDVVARQIVQRVLLIWAGADSVRHSLDVVADLLVDVAIYIGDLGVLDAVFVAVVGGNLGCVRR